MAKNKQNMVRINAGIWRSRVLKFPDVVGLRPTSDRVRQTVFNWLGQDLIGLQCLDLFAGTGVMGFEALSRNAKQVTMIELTKPAYQALLKNKTMLSADSADILQQDAMHYLSNNQQLFDLIFCDPPFNQGWLDKLLPQLAQHLKPDGLLYVECEFPLDKADFVAHWTIIKQKKAGNVHYHLLQADLGTH